MTMGERIQRRDDHRDRLAVSAYEDESPRPKYIRYQAFLDQAYICRSEGALPEAWQLLGENAHLSMSRYQRARTEYLSGEYCRMQELAVPASTRDEKRTLLMAAADHFRAGANAARLIPDWAMYAQLKSLESAACATGEVQALQRAFISAREALKAWRSLPFRNLTADVYFEFNLADTVAVRALNVSEFAEAIDALERAAVLLLRLRRGHDVDPHKYVNDDVFLHWDWANVYVTQGDNRSAFNRIVKARRNIGGLTNPINVGRLHCVVASIAIACAEELDAKSPTRGRLLKLAKAEIEQAYHCTSDCNDQNGFAMMLLADALWLGLSGRKRGRIKRLKEAHAIASTLQDPSLAELVRIGWGDEYAMRGDFVKAVECYRNAEASLARQRHADLARRARLRVDRLPPVVADSASETTVTPPSDGDISPN
jgi:tetratricopeptide (TPR) repeat protein